MQPRMRMVGELLQERREDLGLDLDEIGAMLRIKPTYLAALEQGRTHDLPGPTYAIGFVRAYADFLGLDSEPVLARFKAEAAGVTARPDLALPVPLGERSLPGGALVLVALIMALCGYGIWYYLSTEERNRPERVAAVPAALLPPSSAPVLVAPPPPTVPSPPGANDNPPQPAAPSLFGAAANPSQPPPASPPAMSAATPPPTAPLPAAAPPPTSPPPAATTLAPSAVVTPTPRTAAVAPSPTQAAPPLAPAQTAPTPAQVAPAAPTQAVPRQPPVAQTVPASAQPVPAAPPATSPAASTGRISVRALADCWIQVRTADQSIVFSRVLKSGEIYNVPTRPGLSLRTGNAGALEIAVDGKTAPSIGGIGALRRDVALDPTELAAGTAVHG
ncbi:MAG TPA: RodZ domain-containing protein [Stellaceae bacterium]|nr:RodZ domain-containing protein [Stellaceae bacterium]